ncbi:MAG: hypothetical protein O7D34_05255 [Ignavibacteria bacterium]|nr:hypothetical protein [Ignavibacteria bacterium]
MKEAEVQLFIVAVEEIKDKFDLQLEKTQELLERVECIDNTLNDWESNKDIPEILEGVKVLIQQGRP